MRTHQLLTREHSRKVAEKQANRIHKPVTLWSLYKRNGGNRFVRISDAAYTDVNVAYTVYRDRLIESCFEHRVRKVEE